jgi:hypothetical protein
MPDNLSREIGQKKDEWRQEFRQIRAEITRLEAYLDELRRKLNAADEILAAARIKQKPVPNGKYSNMGLTPALRAFFTEHRFTAHSISELRQRLEQEGMKTDARDLRANISMICRRLEKDENFLASELRGGVRMFRLQTATATTSRKEQAGAGKPTPAVQNVFKQ